MRKINRVIRNDAANTWASASEISEGSKRKSSRAVTAAVALLVAGGAAAAPAESTDRCVAGQMSTPGGCVYTVAYVSGDASPGGQIGVRAGGFNGGEGLAITHNTSLSPATAVASGDIAVGGGAYAGGSGANGNDDYATLVGDLARADGKNTAAFGNRSRATAEGATALGAKSLATQAAATTVGAGSRALGESSSALGYNAIAGAESSVAIGETSSVAEQAAYGMALGAGATVSANAAGAVALGAGATSSGASAVALGLGANVAGDFGLALGAGSGVAADATNAVALGANSYAGRANTVSVGSAALQRQIVNVASGVQDADAVNVSQLKGVVSAFGGGAQVGADGSIAAPSYRIGDKTYTNVGDALAAVAQGGSGSMPDAVLYDDGTHAKLTLGGTGSARPVALTNVADGTSRYDAVNYGQLSALQSKVSDLDDRVGRLGSGTGDGNPYFGGTDTSGGNAGTNPANPGTGTGNTASGSGATIADGFDNGTAIGSAASVKASHATAAGAGAVASGSGSTAIGQGASASGATSAALGQNASATGSNSVALGAGSVADEDHTVAVGASGSKRRITHAADGVNASDVATKGQLDRAIGGVQGQINDVSRHAYSGIAAATALTMIPGVDVGKRLSFGIGGGTYKGYQAVAMGGEARITDNIKMKAGVGLSSAGTAAGVGASYQW